MIRQTMFIVAFREYHMIEFRDVAAYTTVDEAKEYVRRHHRFMKGMHSFEVAFNDAVKNYLFGDVIEQPFQKVDGVGFKSASGTAEYVGSYQYAYPITEIKGRKVGNAAAIEEYRIDVVNAFYPDEADDAGLTDGPAEV